MKNKKYFLAYIFLVLFAGCETGNGDSSAHIKENYSAQDLGIKKEEINRIKYQFSCGLNQYQDAYNFINAYLRDSTSHDFNVLDHEAYRNNVEQDLALTAKYISPSYLAKYYVTPETSIIIDSYGYEARRPELVCIKKTSEFEYEANIFTYAEKYNDYAVVDKLVVVVEGGRKYIYPQNPVSNVPAIGVRVYRKIGVRVMPTSEIRVLKEIYRQRPLSE